MQEIGVISSKVRRGTNLMTSYKNKKRDHHDSLFLFLCCKKC